MPFCRLFEKIFLNIRNRLVSKFDLPSTYLLPSFDILESTITYIPILCNLSIPPPLLSSFPHCHEREADQSTKVDIQGGGYCGDYMVALRDKNANTFISLKIVICAFQGDKWNKEYKLFGSDDDDNEDEIVFQNRHKGEKGQYRYEPVYVHLRQP